MPSDLDQLAQDADHQAQWGTPPTGNGLQDVASRGLPPPDPAPYAFTRAQEHQQRWGGTPDLGSGLTTLARQAAYAPFGALKSFNDLIGRAMTDEDLYSRAYAGAELAKDIVTSGMGAAPKGALGMAGGALRTIKPARELTVTPEAKALYDKTFGRFTPIDEFTSQYLGDMHHPGIAMVTGVPSKYHGPTLVISGPLKDKGETVGHIMRTIEPGKNYSYHNSLEIDPDLRSGGYSKRILGGQFQFYEDHGIKKIGILSTDDGAGIWGKYGWDPTLEDWEVNVKPIVAQRIKQFPLNADDRLIVERALSSYNPKAMRLINDIKTPMRPLNWKPGQRAESTVGFQLLRGTHWQGEFDFDDPDQLWRNREYLKR